MSAVPGQAGKREGGLLLAALFMALAAVFGAVDGVIVRMLAGDVHPFVIGFFRSLFGLVFFAPWILSHRQILRSNHRAAHLVRAGLKLLALTCFFAAFAAAPLADVTAIMFTGPIFVTLGAGLVLGERLGPMKLVAVALGFCGALIVIGPGRGSGMSPALLLALAGAALNAAVQLMLKKMAGRDNTDTLVAWNLILIVPLAVIPAAFFWSTPDLHDLFLLVLQGTLGALSMLCITRALSLADASFLAPIDYMRLPTVALLAFVMFGEVAGLATWIGASVILVAALLATARNGLATLRARFFST